MDWEKISYMIPGRNLDDCKKQYELRLIIPCTGKKQVPIQLYSGASQVVPEEFSLPNLNEDAKRENAQALCLKNEIKDAKSDVGLSNNDTTKSTIGFRKFSNFNQPSMNSLDSWKISKAFSSVASKEYI